MARRGRMTIDEADKLHSEAKKLGALSGPILPFWCGAYYDPLTNILCLLHPCCVGDKAQLDFIMSHPALIPVLVSTLPKSRTNRNFWQLKGNHIIDPKEL